MWLTYIVLFPRDIVEWMLLSPYCAKLLNEEGSPYIKGILHTVAVGEWGRCCG